MTAHIFFVACDQPDIIMERVIQSALWPPPGPLVPAPIAGQPTADSGNLEDAEALLTRDGLPVLIQKTGPDAPDWRVLATWL